jgi:hypothetical protein
MAGLWSPVKSAIRSQKPSDSILTISAKPSDCQLAMKHQLVPLDSTLETGEGDKRNAGPSGPIIASFVL